MLRCRLADKGFHALSRRERERVNLSAAAMAVTLEVLSSLGMMQIMHVQHKDMLLTVGIFGL
jgi:hypothetical protein